MKIDRTKKTIRRKLLMTAWSYPGTSVLLLNGTKQATRRKAKAYFLEPDINPRLLKGVEGYWSIEEVNNLSEWEG